MSHGVALSNDVAFASAQLCQYLASLSSFSNGKRWSGFLDGLHIGHCARLVMARLLPALPRHACWPLERPPARRRNIARRNCSHYRKGHVQLAFHLCATLLSVVAIFVLHGLSLVPPTPAWAAMRPALEQYTRKGHLVSASRRCASTTSRRIQATRSRDVTLATFPLLLRARKPCRDRIQAPRSLSAAPPALRFGLLVR